MDISLQTVTLRDVYDEPINVTKSSIVHFHGIENGNIYVSGNSQVVLYGIVNGNIHVEFGSSVDIHGMVNATTIETTGLVTIFGIVNCESLDLNSVRIMPKAVINGITY